jgi:hypothetical protein
VKQLADAILEGKTNTTAEIERQKSDGSDK